MNRDLSSTLSPGFSRRSLLLGALASCLGFLGRAAAKSVAPHLPDTTLLLHAAHRSGRVLGMFTVDHDLEYQPSTAALIADTFSMIADGNDLKFSDRLRPSPVTFNFVPGDAAIAWADQHRLLFRGHCLVWWNALPRWFESYVTPANAQQVMTSHITAVVKHYAGRVYSWDVVNEPIYHDHRPDGLRRKPWLDLIGPEYIDLAFHTAHAADPATRLVLNECYIEHDTPGEIERRGYLLALATRLRKANVPVTHIGIQGHLHANTPLDTEGLKRFAQQIQDLGLEIMITELDVDPAGTPEAVFSQTAADRYAEFIETLGPYTHAITFESLRERPGDATVDLFDANYQPTSAYTSVLGALNQLGSQATGRAGQPAWTLPTAHSGRW